MGEWLQQLLLCFESSRAHLFPVWEHPNHNPYRSLHVIQFNPSTSPTGFCWLDHEQHLRSSGTSMDWPLPGLKKKGIKLIRLLTFGHFNQETQQEIPGGTVKSPESYWLMCTMPLGRVKSQRKLIRWHRMEQWGSEAPKEGGWHSHHIIEPSFGRFGAWCSSFSGIFALALPNTSLQWFYVSFCFFLPQSQS